MKDTSNAVTSAPPTDKVSNKIPTAVWSLLSATACVALGFGIVAPVIPQLAGSFGVGPAMAGLVISVFALFRLAFAPWSSWSSDTFGYRNTYGAGLIIVAASSAACAVAATYTQLLILRGLGGIGSTMFTVASAGLLARVSPPHMRGRVMSMFAGVFIVGGITGPAIGALIAPFGMHMPFLVYAVTVAIAALVAFATVREPKEVTKEDGSKLEPITLREAFNDSAYRAAISAAFANGWTNFGMRNALMPLFIAGVFAVGATNDQVSAEAGIVLSLYSAGAAIGTPLAGTVADKLGRRLPILVGCVCTGLAMLAFGMVDNLWIMSALAIVGGLGSGLSYSPIQAIMADVIGNDRSGGKAVATLQMASDLGAIVSPVVAGLIASYYGYGAAFATATVMMAAAGFMTLIGRESKPDTSSSDSPTKTA